MKRTAYIKCARRGCKGDARHTSKKRGDFVCRSCFDKERDYRQKYLEAKERKLKQGKANGKD
jgi:recombinational DNA repair protein (RecF pathway)